MPSTKPHASTLRRIATLPLVCAALWHAPGAHARTLLVGPGAAFATPSAAAAVAQPGDRVQIAAGTYYDCSVWSVPGLVIAGAGAAATRLTDRTCAGKAILVIGGRDTTVADLTLARARVPDGNGAGIRAEAPGLTLQRLRFEDDQDGLLAGDQPDGVLRVEDCDFAGNGVAGGAAPTASLLVGRWRELQVLRSRFGPERGQSAIVSAALLTRIAASHLDAAGSGATLSASGGLVVEDSTLAASDGPAGRHAAVLALPGAAPLVLHGDVLLGGGTLLLNWSGNDADLAANRVGQGREASTAGAWRFRLGRAAHAAYGALRHAAGALRGRLLGLLR